MGQFGVVRWIQQDGKDVYLPTHDVIASPPALKLEPGKEMKVRLVRTVATPVNGEECYRVLVDQSPNGEHNGSFVKITSRQSVPLCFDSPKQVRGQMSWQVKRSGKQIVLTGANSGQPRIVLLDATIAGPNGVAAKISPLVLLGGSTMSWPLRVKPGALAPGTTYTLSAKIGKQTVTATGR